MAKTKTTMRSVVTAAVGGTAKPVGILYIEPDRQMIDPSAGTTLVDSGLEPDFLADFLSACLAHERCGLHLYRSAAGRSTDRSLVTWYEHFGEETAEHVRLLEQLIESSGGNPAYVSPAARATELAAVSILQSTFMGTGSVDADTAELAILEAVMLAEAKDRANWEVLTQLAAQITDESLRNQFETVTEQVLAQEVEHHSWARDTRAAMLIAHCGGTPPDVPGGRRRERTSEETTTATKAELYETAKQLDIEGRSSMTREELAEAVAQREGGRS